MSTKQWLFSFLQKGLSAVRRRAAPITFALVSALMAHAGVVVGYYQGYAASSVPLKTLVTNGSAAELNYLIYAFEEPNSNGSCTIADLTTATQTPYTAANSVNGEADTGPLKGTFNQLKELKAKYPNLKVLMSIGGSALSGNFSNMASAAASNASAIDACATMFINGNFTSTLKGYSGIFDGIDIDWEYPASSTDEANFTALLKAFHNELATLGAQNGKTYILTATMGADNGQYGTEYINIPAAAQYLTYVNVMNYDYEASGGTAFNAPLYGSSINPDSPYNNSNSEWFTYNLDATFTGDTANYKGYIPQFEAANPAIPISKLLVGIPFYGLQYSHVPAGETHGLFQETSSGETAISYSQIVQQYLGQPQYAQYCDYGNSSSPYECSANAGLGSQETWLYDGSNNFISFDNEISIAAKIAFAKKQKLGGVLVWDLTKDSPGGCLMSTIYTNMTGNKAVNQDTALYNFENGVQSWAANNGVSVLDSEGEAFSGCKSLGVSFTESSQTSADVYVLSPSGIKPGQTITMRVWVPAGSKLVSLNPFITNTSWTWLASDYKTISELTAGAWNTFSFTVPSNAPTTFGELGVELDSSEPWTGRVYIDSITN